MPGYGTHSHHQRPLEASLPWWSLRQRFERTYRAVVHRMEVDPDSSISIDPGLPELAQLLTELSQPTYSINGAGKVLVDKKPGGAKSPNLADAVMIALYSRASPTWRRGGITGFGDGGF